MRNVSGDCADCPGWCGCDSHPEVGADCAGHPGVGADYEAYPEVGADCATERERRPRFVPWAPFAQMPFGILRPFPGCRAPT